MRHRWKDFGRIAWSRCGRHRSGPAIALGALIAIVGPFTGCGSSTSDGGDNGGCACTLEFRAFTVRVVDTSGAPVSGVDMTVTILRTGLQVDMTDREGPDGVYIIIDDSLIDAIQTGGDVVRVEGMKDGASFRADFVFDVPGPCRCHVTRVSGPAEVVLE